jgi:hypothetical protein
MPEATAIAGDLAVTELEFSELAEQWKAETCFHSSLSKKFTHPAYQMIMAMGKDALPLILQRLEREPDHWFYALKFIARKDVGQGAASFEDARSKWLEWGRLNRYL